jgi:signal peptidase I
MPRVTSADGGEVTDQTPADTIVPTGAAPYSDQRRRVALRRVNRRGFRWRLIRDWGQSVVIALAIWLVLRAFFVEGYRIPTGSMERTLLVGDFLLVNKLAYGAELPFTARRLPGLIQPHRGDIIVFRWPTDRRTHFIKRLVGMPGDTLAMRDGTLFVNGTAQVEPYAIHIDSAIDPAEDEFQWQRRYIVHGTAADEADHPSRNNWGPLVVPQQSYFVLGDNRDNSLDSRYWGFVPAVLIEGRPIFVYYSYAPDTAGHVPLLTRVRWHRIGERVE